MSLSDCPKCWDTPCTCGHEWKQKSTKRLIETRDMLNRIIDEREIRDGISEEDLVDGIIDVLAHASTAWTMGDKPEMNEFQDLKNQYRNLPSYRYKAEKLAHWLSSFSEERPERPEGTS